MKYKKWQLIIKKIKNDQILNPEELKYYSNLTRIYKNSSVTSRSKIYHTKLSLDMMKNHHAKSVEKIRYTIVT